MKTINEEYIPPILESMQYPKLKLNETVFCILDTETTGIDNDDEVVELAVIDMLGNELYHSCFEPEKEVHWAAAKKTGITRKKLLGQPKFKDEWPEIKKILSGKLIIGHNISFDCRLIEQTAARYQIDKVEVSALFARNIDSMDIAKEYLKKPEDVADYKLETLCAYFGYSEEQRHRATYDCLMVLYFLRKLEKSDKMSLSFKKSTASPRKGVSIQQKLSKAHSEHSKEDQQQIFNFNSRALKSEIIKRAVPAGVTISQLAAIFKNANSTVEEYIIDIIKEGGLSSEYFLSSDTETAILDAVKSIQEWDGRLKPVKELLPDSIS